MSDYKTPKGVNAAFDAQVIARYTVGATTCYGLKAAAALTISTGATMAVAGCVIGAIIIGGFIWYFVSHF